MAFNAGSTRRHVVNGGSHVAGSPFSAQETCGALWESRLKQLEPTPKANAACATQVKRTKRAVARQLMLCAALALVGTKQAPGRRLKVDVVCTFVTAAPRTVSSLIRLT